MSDRDDELLGDSEDEVGTSGLIDDEEDPLLESEEDEMDGFHVEGEEEGDETF